MRPHAQRPGNTSIGRRRSRACSIPTTTGELRDVVSGYLRQHSAAAICRAAEGADRAARRLHLFGRHRRGRVRDRLRRCGRSFAASCSSARVIACICAAWQCRRRARSQRRSGAVAIDRRAEGAAAAARRTSSSPTRRTRRSTASKCSCRSCKMLFDDFTLLPVVLGVASRRNTSRAALAQVWGDAETLVLVSSDLSHYHTYDAGAADRRQHQRRDPAPRDRPCGRAGLRRRRHQRPAASRRPARNCRSRRSRAAIPATPPATGRESWATERSRFMSLATR